MYIINFKIVLVCFSEVKELHKEKRGIYQFTFLEISYRVYGRDSLLLQWRERFYPLGPPFFFSSYYHQYDENLFKKNNNQIIFVSPPWPHLLSLSLKSKKGFKIQFIFSYTKLVFLFFTLLFSLLFLPSLFLLFLFFSLFLFFFTQYGK